MTRDDLEKLSEALNAERPEGPQVIQGERIIWRRIVDRLSLLAPKDARTEFLVACGYPKHLVPELQDQETLRMARERLSQERGGNPDDASDPKVATLVVNELRIVCGMTDDQFRALHHRRNLWPSEGISAHLRYLAKLKTRLRPDQQDLARRLDACLRYRREGKPWVLASQLALKEFPIRKARKRLH